VGQDIVRLNHGRRLSIRNGEVVRRLRRVPGRWWEHAEEVSISGFRLWGKVGVKVCDRFDEVLTTCC
jgi:hypothetical protein